MHASNFYQLIEIEPKMPLRAHELRDKPEMAQHEPTLATLVLDLVRALKLPRVQEHVPNYGLSQDSNQE